MDGKDICITRNLNISGSHVEISAASSFTRKFPKTSTSQLSIVKSSVMAIPFGLRAIFPSLEVLNITGSNLKHVARKSVAGLTAINFSQNQIQKLDIDTFWNCPQLKFLNLNFNKITNLDENLFIYLSELEEFSADYNQIASLHRDIFNGNQKLRKFSFAGNALKEIQVDFFNLANIVEINLRQNECIDMSINTKKEMSLAKLKFQQEIVIKCMY